MRQMKNSGIEWIGEIPEDWEQTRLKSLFIDRCGGAWGDEAQNDENDIVCIRVADFDFEKQTVKAGDKTLRNYQSKVIDKLMLRESDLLIEKSGGGGKTPVGRTILATGCQGFLFANFIDRLRIRSPHNTKFIAYLFRTLYCNGVTFPYVKQTTGIQNLDTENLLREVVYVPCIENQQKIVDFLDKKCADIDSLLAHEESVIEELKAYKQSVITEAVTKGLDRSVHMKDSGVEWIEKIPAAWEVVLLSSVFHQHKERNSRLQETNLLSLSYGRIIQKDINAREGLLPTSFDTYNVIDNGDIILRLTDLQNDQRSLRTGLCTQKGIITSAYITLRKNVDLDSRFMHYLFHSYDICKVFYGMGDGVRQGMNFEDLKRLLVLFPTKHEQQQIADYLDKRCAEIDSLISIKQQKIEKLKEYKKSLIYEYVTGKKEVA